MSISPLLSAGLVGDRRKVTRGSWHCNRSSIPIASVSSRKTDPIQSRRATMIRFLRGRTNDRLARASSGCLRHHGMMEIRMLGRRLALDDAVVQAADRAARIWEAGEAGPIVLGSEGTRGPSAAC